MSLLGTWVVDLMDVRALDELGDVHLDFRDDGQLIYTVRSKTKNQVMRLRYRVEGSTIVTDQLSAPQVERTDFSLDQDGILILAFGGVPYRFRREKLSKRVGLYMLP